MMKAEEKLFKALQTVSLGYSRGAVSADVLIKACDKYKSKIHFEDDYDYELVVAKSLYDSINGVEQDVELTKSILPGQTKMIDGVMYVWTATPGAKTDYDWRVVKKGTNGKSVGRGDTLTDAQIDQKQKFVNSLFPKDLSTLKVIKQLGGSTGAQLVEDVNGNQYVMKKGTNTSNEHVKSEYLANQLYSALGQRVPDYELYDDNGTAVLLSRYIPMTSVPNGNDYPEMAKGIIADVLLANWDVYQNDNCLKDAAGRIIRVDNGGSLMYKAQGGLKPTQDWTGDVTVTFRSMKRYNPQVFSQVDDNDMLKMIAEAQKKKDIVVNFLAQSGQTNLSMVMAQRFDNLTKIADDIKRKQALKNHVIVPRNLKPAVDMYKVFTQDELDTLWKATPGKSARNKLYHTTDSEGWKLLSDICKERGFDARPRVVDDATYWSLLAKAKNPQIMRGLTSGGGMTVEECVASFKYDDVCFYGQYGIYGEGIYAHVNDHKTRHQSGKSDYMLSKAYSDAMGYSNNNDDGILLMAFEDDVKIADVDDLKKEILSSPPVGGDPKTVAKLDAEIKKLSGEIAVEENELNNITQNTINDVYKRMHFDQASITDMEVEISDTDWGARTPSGEPDYPKWDDFVAVKMAGWVKANGGSVVFGGDSKSGKAWAEFKLPNSSETFHLSQATYESPGAIKQKNQFTKPYNYPVVRFEEWFTSQHIAKIESVKNYEIKQIGKRVNVLRDSIKDKKQKLTDVTDQLNKLHNPDPDKDIYSAIYHDVKGGNLEAIGVYAALKGYDALYAKNGNGSGHGFTVILNRSKIIVKK